MMIQSWHVALKYSLSTALPLTLTINHIIYCHKCMLMLFNIKNKHIGDFAERFLLVYI